MDKSKRDNKEGRHAVYGIDRKRNRYIYHRGKKDTVQDMIPSPRALQSDTV